METKTDMVLHGVRDVIALLAIAVLIRGAFAMGAPRVLESADAIHYIEAAKHLAAGEFAQVAPGVPILYPLLAAVAHAAAPDWETACIVISFLASILLVPLAYGLALDLHGSRAARLAGLTVAMWPWLVDYAGRIGPDALGCTLWFASVWLLARGTRRGGIYLFGAALTFVALAFTRAEGVFLLPTALVAAVVFLRPRDRADLSRLGRFAAAAVILMFLCAAASTHVLGHAPIGYRVFRILQDWGVTPFEVARMRAGEAGAEAVIAQYVLIPFARTTFKTLFDVLPIMLGPVFMTFLGVGLLSAWQSASQPRDLPLEGFVLALAAAHWLLTLPVLSPEPRYLMSPLAVLSLWSIRGVLLVSADARGHRHGRWLSRVPAGVLLATLALGLGTMAAADRMRSTPGEPLEYKLAGGWMKENLAPGLIFTRKPQIGYYAGMPSTGPDLDDSVDKAVVRARNAGVRYFVVDERYTAKMAPALEPLLEPANAPPSLKYLKSFAPFPQGRVTIYQLVGTL